MPSFVYAVDRAYWLGWSGRMDRKRWLHVGNKEVRYNLQPVTLLSTTGHVIHCLLVVKICPVTVAKFVTVTT